MDLGILGKVRKSFNLITNLNLAIFSNKIYPQRLKNLKSEKKRTTVGLILISGYVGTTGNHLKYANFSFPSSFFIKIKNEHCSLHLSFS